MKIYYVEAKWETENPLLEIHSRSFTTTRKREAVAKASEFWNEMLTHPNAKWICNPNVVKTENALVTARFVITGADYPRAEGNWGAKEWETN